MDYSWRYSQVGYYKRLLKPVYLKMQITTLSLYFWETQFKVFENIAIIRKIAKNRKIKRKEMENHLLFCSRKCCYRVY